MSFVVLRVFTKNSHDHSFASWSFCFKDNVSNQPLQSRLRMGSPAHLLHWISNMPPHDTAIFKFSEAELLVDVRWAVNGALLVDGHSGFPISSARLAAHTDLVQQRQNDLLCIYILLSVQVIRPIQQHRQIQVHLQGRRPQNYTTHWVWVTAIWEERIKTLGL